MIRGPPTRRHFLKLTATTPALAALAGCQTNAPATSATDTATATDPITVPTTQPTIQAGLDAAEPGDLVLVEPGTYEECVTVETAEITLRGEDRNAVVLDGAFSMDYGVDVEADSVAVENLTARHFTNTGIYWDDVEGFRGSYLTAYNNGGYGVYASRSRDGRFEHCYASGHADAGFYLGRNHPFDALVTSVVAEHNALGYSGTSAGGNLTIRDSLWRENGAGIVPHTLDRADPPQRESRIVDNVVLDNANPSVPFRPHTYPAFGTGIFVWGGNENVIESNVVAGHETVGIAIQPHVDEPSGNVVRGNLVRDSGVADLGLGRPTGEGNRFANNGYATSLPEAIEDAASEESASEGHSRITEVYEHQRSLAETGEYPDNDWRTQPEPDPQPSMPDPDAPPQPAGRAASARDTSDGQD